MTALVLAVALASTAGSSAHLSPDDDWANEASGPDPMAYTTARHETGSYRISRGLLSMLGAALLGATPMLLWLPAALVGTPGAATAGQVLLVASCFLEPLAITAGALMVHRLMNGQGAFGVGLLGCMAGVLVGSAFVAVSWSALNFGSGPFDFNQQLALAVGIGIAITGAVVGLEIHHQRNIEELAVVAAPLPGGAIAGLSGRF